jgi:hypothetical protein
LRGERPGDRVSWERITPTLNSTPFDSVFIANAGRALTTFETSRRTLFKRTMTHLQEANRRG